MNKLTAKVNQPGKPGSNEDRSEIEHPMRSASPRPSAAEIKKGVDALGELVVPDHRPFLWTGEPEIWAMQKAKLADGFDYRTAAALWNVFASSFVTPEVLERDLRSMLGKLRWGMLGRES